MDLSTAFNDDSVTDNISLAKEMIDDFKKDHPYLYQGLFTNVISTAVSRTGTTVIYAQGSTACSLKQESSSPTILCLTALGLLPANLLKLCVRTVMAKSGFIQYDYDSALESGSLPMSLDPLPVLYGVRPRADDPRFTFNLDGSVSFFFFGIKMSYVPVRFTPYFKTIIPMELKMNGWGVMDHLFLGVDHVEERDVLSVAVLENFSKPICPDAVIVSDNASQSPDLFQVPMDSFLFPAISSASGYIMADYKGKGCKISCKFAQKGDLFLMREAQVPQVVAVKVPELTVFQSTMLYAHWLTLVGNEGPSFISTAQRRTIIACSGNRFIVPSGLCTVCVDDEAVVLDTCDVLSDVQIKPSDLMHKSVVDVSFSFDDDPLRSAMVDDMKEDIPFLRSWVDIKDGYLMRKGVGGYYSALMAQFFMVMGVPFASDVYASVGWTANLKDTATFAYRIALIFSGCHIEEREDPSKVGTGKKALVPYRLIYTYHSDPWLDKLWDYTIMGVEHSLVKVLSKMGVILRVPDLFVDASIFCGVFDRSDICLIRQISDSKCSLYYVGPLGETKAFEVDAFKPRTLNIVRKELRQYHDLIFDG